MLLKYGIRVAGIGVLLVLGLWGGVMPILAQTPLPPSGGDGGPSLDQVAVLELPAVDVPALLARDRVRARLDVPARFATPLKTAITPANGGSWETLNDGSRLWRLRIHGAGARSLNLGFTRYRMSVGGELRIYDPAQLEVIGPFTAADNESHGQLWTPMVDGEEVVVELRLPKGEALPDLELGVVNYGYNSLENALALYTGSCNEDVVCPDGDAWRDEIRSVGAVTVYGVDICSGALINNTAEDRKPYFLTAYHCGIDAGNAATAVVYWNYQNSFCRTPGSGLSGMAGDGQRTQFNTGAIWRAAYDGTDFTLIELDDPIEPSYDPYWVGWDRSPGNFVGAVGIHHPNVEEKRISIDTHALQITTYRENTVPGDGTHLRITDWDTGTTEIGSSGSPLFNMQHRLIGQLHGGLAACGNNSSDWYGRFAISWTGGEAVTSRLSDWLDPLGRDATTLDGRNWAAGFHATINPNRVGICRGQPAVYAIETTGVVSEALAFDVIGEPAGAAVTFDPVQIVPPGITAMTVSNTGSLVAGTYVLTALVASSSESMPLKATLNVFAAVPGGTTLSSPADNSFNLTPTPLLSWNGIAAAQGYRVEIARDAQFNGVVYSAFVDGESHWVSTPLEANTAYYWRVIPYNACGWGSPTPAFVFRTDNRYCRISNLAVPDNVLTGITDTLVVTGSSLVADLNVYVEILHPYLSDLNVKLQRATGTSTTTVTLLDPVSCSYDDIQVTLDDEAAQSVVGQCNNSVPSINGVFQPYEPLAAFDGGKFAGSWRLTVADNSSEGTGVLVRWCLIPTVIWGAAPVADFSPRAVTMVEDRVISFTNLTTGTAPVTYSWDFGDGGLSLSQNPVYTYTQAGFYTVTLTAFNEYGVATATGRITVTPGVAPVADFSPREESLAIGTEVTFTNLTVGTAPLTYSWDFGDGGSSEAVNPTHTYGELGGYTVTLRAVNAYGVGTATGRITVTPASFAPIAAFSVTPTVGMVGEPVTFTNETIGTLPISYSWMFGDGFSSPVTDPVHIYSEPATYTVSLRATNALGQGIITHTVVVVAHWRWVYLPLVLRSAP